MTKAEVDKLGLNSGEKAVFRPTERGADFGFGHIYHILTNPIYAGRIRRHAKVYPGKHLLITASDVWDLLQVGAVVSRSGKGRIQQLIEFSFLAPEVIRDVLEGRQPIGLTTEWRLRHAYSPIWQDLRDIFGSL